MAENVSPTTSLNLDKIKEAIDAVEINYTSPAMPQEARELVLVANDMLIEIKRLHADVVPVDRTPLDPMVCLHCPDGHASPTSRSWAVWVASDRDSDGQPTHLYVCPSAGQHVAESDAVWLRALMHDDAQKEIKRLAAQVERVEALCVRAAQEPFPYGISPVALARDICAVLAETHWTDPIPGPCSDPVFVPGVSDGLEDHRNVVDKYKWWSELDIKDDLIDNRSNLIPIFLNFDHDFNISSGIRNANWFNTTGPKIVGRRSFDSRGCVGAHHYMNIEKCPDIENVIIELRNDGYRITAAEIVDNAIPLDEYMFATKTAVIFGQESCGISDDILDLCDDVVYIRGMGSVRSLNVAATSAIFMYEYGKQRCW